MKIISVKMLVELIERHGWEAFMVDLMKAIKSDFGRWHEFTNVPRSAMHVPGGVLELMPICDSKFYSFKYVNCHPKNPLIGKQTIIATGQLSEISTGYPLLFSEMTLLTAFRTAATAALATDLMARKNATVMAIIGTGAQSEFQVRALKMVRDIQEVRYYDIDAKAMDKFAHNLSGSTIKFVRCTSAKQAVKGADIVTVCTACKQHVDVIKNDWISDGMHINALGGDTIGKTELEMSILGRSQIVVEYFEQSYIEGEIQRLDKQTARKQVHAELHEIITGNKSGRGNQQAVTLFDSVGIALEDYSALRLTHKLAETYNLGVNLALTPTLDDPKDLIGILAK